MVCAGGDGVVAGCNVSLNLMQTQDIIGNIGVSR